MAKKILPRETTAQVAHRIARSAEMSYEMLFMFHRMHPDPDEADHRAAWVAVKKEIQGEIEAALLAERTR